MMNSFFRSEIPPKMFLHYKAMFKNTILFIFKRMMMNFYSNISTTIQRFISFSFSCFTYIFTVFPRTRRFFLIFKNFTNFPFSFFRMFISNSWHNILLKLRASFNATYEKRLSFIAPTQSPLLTKKPLLISIIIISFILSLSSISYCDQLMIPFQCSPQELQAAYADNGVKLDLTGNDMTPESFGFIENKGTHVLIQTYRSATQQDFYLLNKVIFGGYWADYYDKTYGE